MSVHDEWLEKIKFYKSSLEEKFNKKVQLPPPTLQELQMEYLEIIPGQKMLARLPFQQRFTNPMGTYQGGFLGAAVDEVLGPLSYVTAGVPCMTLSLNMTFLKPFSANLKTVTIEGIVLQKTQSLIFMRAEIKNEAQELIAHCESHVMIMREEQLKKG